MSGQRVWEKLGLVLKLNRKSLTIGGIRGIRFRLSPSGLVAIFSIPNTGVEKQKTLISKKMILSPPGIYVTIALLAVIILGGVWMTFR